jgi:hypothetical protein
MIGYKSTNMVQDESVFSRILGSLVAADTVLQAPQSSLRRNTILLMLALRFPVGIFRFCFVCTLGPLSFALAGASPSSTTTRTGLCVGAGNRISHKIHNARRSAP